MFVGPAVATQWMPLDKAPKKIEQFHEIAVCAPQNLPPLYNNLKPAERIFLYLLFRAGLPGNRILADQLHRDASSLIDIFESVVRNKQTLLEKKENFSFDIEQFVNQATTFAVYLWTNHSHYYSRENADHKRTPELLSLDLVTNDNLTAVLEALGDTLAASQIKRLNCSLFDKRFEPTLVVPGSIEKSGGNLYSSDFTDDDFATLTAEEQKSLNSYFYIAENGEQRVARTLKYKIDGRFNKELRVTHYWLQEAMVFAQLHPECFDSHIVKSLEYFLRYIENGDEQMFRRHSIEWLQTKSHIDYTFGFIETYMDPMSYRGSYSAEVTIKSLDIDALNAMLPSIEVQLPVPKEYKRENLEAGTASVPNASMNVQVWGTAEYGPMKCVAAYCLPNYNDIRSDHGSKQIIYETTKGLGALINPERNALLFYTKEKREWAKKYDPEFQLGRDIWTVQCILHETLGHASGKLAQHTFTDGDIMTISGITYKIGDTIDVTSENIQQFLVGFDQTLEELRAEIIALYTSIKHYDELAEQNMFKDWPSKIDKKTMIDALIVNMAQTGLRRLLVQQTGATNIAGDHARANYAILNYLLDHGGLEIIEELVTVNGNEHTVLGLRVTDQDKVIENVTTLLQEVQRIKSTGDSQGVAHLINTYGQTIRNVEYISYLKANLKAVQGDLKAVATLYPDFTPVINEKGQITDVVAKWPSGIVEQQLKWSDLALSIN